VNDGGHDLSGNSGKSPWGVIAIVVAVIALIIGLVIIGLLILSVMAIGSWGSNK
jgi:hypothetical protein